MTSTTESLTPAPISQALAVTVAYMDYRYQITQQYGRHWTWTCNQVEWSQEGARFVYRCRVRVQIRFNPLPRP